MNAAAIDFGQSDADIFDAMSTDCTLVRGAASPVNGRCVVEDGVDMIGQYGEVVGRATHVTFIKTEWDPARGDTVTLDGNARQLEKIVSDDGYVVRGLLHG